MAALYELIEICDENSLAVARKLENPRRPAVHERLFVSH